MKYCEDFLAYLKPFDKVVVYRSDLDNDFPATLLPEVSFTEEGMFYYIMYDDDYRVYKVPAKYVVGEVII